MEIHRRSCTSIFVGMPESDSYGRSCFEGIALTLALMIPLMLASCGGSSSGSRPGPTIRVLISPASINVNEGATQTFSPTVTGTANTAVNWHIVEGAAGGSITSSGVYTAPNAHGTFHIVATSQVDSSVFGVASAIVPSVGITLSSATSSPYVAVNGSNSFSASVSGTVNTAVTWTVREGSGGGTIALDDPLGDQATYSAPHTPGTYHVVATSVADPSKWSSSTVDVVIPFVTISPGTETLGPQGSRQFASSVTAMADQSVTWSVQEGPAGGSVNANGLYTAPSTQGTYHLVVTSTTDPTVTGSATITVGAHGFMPVAQMLEARAHATTTLLEDGRVLVAGGCNSTCDTIGGGELASAELFDPATNTFSATGEMSEPRFEHTATRLMDGRVLVVGGFNENGSTASADLYDPATGKFTPTGNLATSRGEHTATLLGDGRVLIAGGRNVTSDLDWAPSEAEVYDPGTGAFSPAGALLPSRYLHTATTLGDGSGKILIAGGENYDYVADGVLELASAELFDPSTGNFSATGTMTYGRFDHTATPLAGGTVLFTGGNHAFCYPYVDEYCQVIGYGPLPDTALYDPKTGGFNEGPVMEYARSGHTAALLPDGSVLIAGGQGLPATDEGWPVSFFKAPPEISPLASAEIYDPNAGTLSLTGSLQFGAYGQSAVVLQDGRVLIVGGFNKDGNAANLAEIYQ